ncbi:Serine/threonine protein kinase [Labilithrix luteola]|uniref:Serine/threonine protein kinase n=1 Tax=Labilithrix luteola TaxID=1391654 RepID=A0A0K1PNC7_9BACT|nr:Serine/threonine protein kinase [Labilithrix luteola]
MNGSPGIASGPAGDDETRKAEALFGSRVSAFARMSGVFTLAFLLPEVIGSRSQGITTLARALAPSLIIGAILLVLGFLAKRVWRDRRMHEVTDALVIFIVCLGFDLTIFGGHVSDRREMVLALVSSNMLIARAAVVPSTGKRSAIIGALAFTPLVVVTFLFYRSSGDPALTWSRTAYAAQWGAVAVAASAGLSRRIYTMQRQVDAARRFGQYTLEQKIGEGGMGEVFRARHAMLRRPTALKLLPRSRSGAGAIARFEREVQMTSRLTHPNTIQIYDYGRAEDGTFYYAMEFLDGLTLEELVLRDGAQHPGRVAHILADICASLAEAHEAGLVHRDIKAQNVMLCARGGAYDVVKVLDFGLVRTAGEESDEPGGLAGTPAYMAPEAIASPEQFDARSDLYAVGALGYFLLTGANVFSGPSAFELLGQHLHATPVIPSERAGREIPASLERLVLTCLAKSPHDRAASAYALCAALTALHDVRATWGQADASQWWREHGERRPANDGTASAHDIERSTRKDVARPLAILQRADDA